jgi:hypothetical protein
MANLIDLGEPSPQPAFTQQPVPPISSGANISAQLAGISALIAHPLITIFICSFPKVSTIHQ